MHVAVVVCVERWGEAAILATDNGATAGRRPVNLCADAAALRVRSAPKEFGRMRASLAIVVVQIEIRKIFNATRGGCDVALMGLCDGVCCRGRHVHLQSHRLSTARSGYLVLPWGHELQLVRWLRRIGASRKFYGDLCQVCVLIHLCGVLFRVFFEDVANLEELLVSHFRDLLHAPEHAAR